ncbi:MAG: hypothetical protein WC133_06355 [Candidatus Omnitrophota bacterium]
MKIFSRAVLTGLLVSAFWVTGIGYAVESTPDVAKEVEKHLAMSKSYEEKAMTQDVLIAEHEQMKKDSKNKYTISSKLGVSPKFHQMEKHCNAIIADATKLRNDLLDFAKWHRMRAAELQGM